MSAGPARGPSTVAPELGSTGPVAVVHGLIGTCVSCADSLPLSYQGSPRPFFLEIF